MRRLRLLLSTFVILTLICISTNVRAYAASSQRIVSADSNNLYLKDAGLTGQWVKIVAGMPLINSAKVAGDRITFLQSFENGDNKLWAKQGSYNSPWILLSENIKSYDLTTDRLAIVMNDGHAFIKVGALTSQFQSLASDVLSIVLSKSRIGIVVDSKLADCESVSGYFHPAYVYVKEYTVTAPWKMIAARSLSDCAPHGTTLNVDLRITDERVAITHVNKLSVKEGGIEAPFRNDLWEDGNVGSVYLGGDKLCIAPYSAAGLYCKVGNLNSGYIKITNQTVGNVVLNENRIGLDIYNDPQYNFVAYEGALISNPSFTLLLSNVTNGSSSL